MMPSLGSPRRIATQRVVATIVLALLPAVVASASEDNGRNWLLVTTPALRDAFEPLVAARRQQGYRVAVISHKMSSEGDGDADVERILARLKQARETGRPTTMLIGGAHLNAAKGAFVPTTRGTHGRMNGQATDHYYCLPDAHGLPTVAVGRLPARDPTEVTAMVRKILRTESEQLRSESPHLSIIVANPGGETRIERQFGEAYLRATVADRLKSFDPELRVEVVADIDNSQFATAGKDFGELAAGALASGSVFTIYCGHASAAGLWSQSRYVLTRDRFASLHTQGLPGVFLSCGCFTCQLDQPMSRGGLGRADGNTEGSKPASQGFGIAAIRNPHGPSAVIGPYGESYSAFGKLAMDALTRCALARDQPSHIGGYWMAIQRGIIRGKIDPLTFFLFDQADGSRGKSSLASQRPEHLEMWTLLGDPAMKLPPLPNEHGRE